MSPRVTPPFRADHAGTLLRPTELISAREQFDAGRLDPEQLRRVEDQATSDVVALQEEIGLFGVTDGEFRRNGTADFVHRLDGVVPVDPAGNGSSDAGIRVEDKIGLPHTIFGDEFTGLADRANSTTPKLTIPSPGMLARIGRSAVDEDVYPDLSAFRADLAGAYSRQVRGLSDLGCHYLQIDDTSFAAVEDTAERRRLVDLVNTAVSDRPDTMAVTLRLIRERRAPWITEGGHDAIAEALFTGLAVDGFYLEIPDTRTADLAALRFVPKGRTVVLGLVDPGTAELESKDALKRQVETASRHIDPEQLCLAPQRGFAAADGRTQEQQIAKLRLVADTAREIWG